MAPPATTGELLTLAQKSGVLPAARLSEVFPSEGDLPKDPRACAVALVKAGLLTPFQVNRLLAGKPQGLVLGSYKLLKPIGQGGMGVVYQAEHTTLKRVVALKILPADKAANRLTLERFMREARSAAALEHPNIVHLYDVGQAAGIHFLVMEFVDGTTLHELVVKTGPLPPATAAHYISQAAAGLQHAHDKGFVHRDVKPANLMLAKGGTVKVLDLGLARSYQNQADELTGNLDSSAVGTVDYVSPEQALNQLVDARSDIYSLGATLYMLLTGSPPFRGSTAQVLMQHQAADPPRLTASGGRYPEGLAEVVIRMLAKKKADRYQSAEEVIYALSPFASGASSGNITLPRSGEIESHSAASRATGSGPLGRRPKWLIPACALGGVAVFVGLNRAVAGFGKSKHPADQPNAGRTSKGLTAPPGVSPLHAPAARPAGDSGIYRMDLNSVQPFAQQQQGRNPEARNTNQARLQWMTHSWEAECVHELFADQRDGRMVIGLRLVSGAPPAGMLFLSGVPVTPGKRYQLRLEYLSAGLFRGGEIRVRGAGATGQPRTIGSTTATPDGWRQDTFSFTAGSAPAVQIEFHHNGPAGEGNELLLASVEVVESGSGN